MTHGGDSTAPQHTAAGKLCHVQAARHHRLPEDGELAALRLLQDPWHWTHVPAAGQPIQRSCLLLRRERRNGCGLCGQKTGSAGHHRDSVLHPSAGGAEAAESGRRRQSRRLLKQHGALTHQFSLRGIYVIEVWDDANAEALRLAEAEGLTYVPPFDHPLLWCGHATLVSEVAASLGPGVKPGAVLLSVGGGGLLCGVVQGLEDVGWQDVPIIAMETVGAHCFNAAVKAGELVTLDDITSEAKCLGAKTVCQKAFEHSRRSDLSIISELVTDQQALHAIQAFLDDERVLVEMACGAALAAVYSGVIRRLQDEGRLPAPLGPLLVIVCGGSSVDMQQLANLKVKLQA